jgi:hypothetical protein
LERAALIARVTAVLVSLAYFVLLLPHFGGITPEHFRSGWFLGAITIALAWFPLLLLNKRLEARWAFSFLPLALFAAYFGALFAGA